MLPFDIICSIIDIAANSNLKADREILLPLSVLDHACSQYANRYIWREVSLVSRGITAQELLERTHAVSRQAGYIRRLDLSFREEIVFDDGERDEVDDAGGSRDPLARSSGFKIRGMEKIKALKAELFEAIANAIFACAGDLEELSIFGPYHLEDIGYALSRATQTLHAPLLDVHASSLPTSSSSTPQKPVTFPRLTTFSSILSQAHGAMPFLTKSCAAVRKWKVTGRHARICTIHVPDALFPSLDTYEGTSNNLDIILRARPVQNVSIIHHIETAPINLAFRDLLSGLSASQVPVTRLSLNLTLSGVHLAIEREGERIMVAQDEYFLYWLARRNPSLRYLELFTHGKFRMEDYHEERIQGFVRGLADMKMLEELDWWDSRETVWWGDRFPRACFEGLASLRIVRVNKKMYQRDSYV